jgi:hypothetical protein
MKSAAALRLGVAGNLNDEPSAPHFWITKQPLRYAVMLPAPLPDIGTEGVDAVRVLGITVLVHDRFRASAL